MRHLPFIAFLLFSAVLGFMLLHKNEPKEMGAASNEAFPGINVTTLDGGKPWKAEAIKGRVTLINFFASWCTPCAEEMPELEALKKEHSNLQIIGIAWNDDPATLKKWLKKYGNPFQSIWVDNDGNATIALGIKGIPESFIVDSEGMVRYRLAGVLTKEMREGDIGNLIQKLLAEAQPKQETPDGR
jgi:cytochrome c biogenesis protein CcmG/thiol:disulfide interchange protein DsbE